MTGSAGEGGDWGLPGYFWGLLVPSHLLGHKYQVFTSPSVLNPSEKRGLSTAINYLLDY